MPLWILLCVLVISPVSQSMAGPYSETIETEWPIGEEKEESEGKNEGKLAARSNVFRFLINPHDLNRISKAAMRLCKYRTQVGHGPTIVGHQLANGQRAPMLI